MKKVLPLILAFIMLTPSFAQKQGQEKIDSLLAELPNAKEDTNKVKTMNELSLSYYFVNPEKGLEYGEMALSLSKELNWKEGEAKSLNSIARCNIVLSNFNIALDNFLKALKILREIGNKQEIAKNLGNIGIIYDNQSNFDKALEYYFKVLQMFEEMENKRGQSTTYSNIGNVFDQQKNYEKALDYYFKALKLDEEIGNKEGIARVLGNIGLTYHEQGNFKKALEYYNKSLRLDEEIGDIRGSAINFLNIGLTYSALLEYDKSLEYHHKSLKYFEEMGNRNGIAFALGNIGSVYFNLTQDSVLSQLDGKKLNISFNKINNLKKAKEYFEKAANINSEIGNIDGYQIYLKYLSIVFAEKGEYKKALEAFKEHIILKDSISSSETKTKIANLEAKRENELKAKEIKILKKEKEYQESKSNYLYALSALIFVVLVVMFFFYRNKRKSNQWLAAKNKVIKEANTELETLNNDLADKNRQISLANTELEELNNDLADKNHTISEAHQKITDSINYAEKIQKAMLPFPERLNEMFKEHFVIYKPKDVVSGDFYWVEQSGGYTFVAVVDCTGHGVPGAFMSIIGYDLLNQIVLVDKIYEPRDILTRLNELVRKALHQKDEIGSQQDGMELSITRIKGDELIFAGARRPLWYSMNGKIEEIKGDKFGIGGRVRKERVFTQQSLKLNRDTKLFMFSDGIIDQNNENEEFFGKERLRTIFTSSEQLSSVSETLNSEFIEFRSEESLRDDITVLGIKL